MVFKKFYLLFYFKTNYLQTGRPPLLPIWVISGEAALKLKIKKRFDHCYGTLLYYGTITYLFT